MPETPLSGLSYPSGPSGPYVAADLQALAEDVDSKVVLRAVDAADRDARYLNPTPGMLVTGDDGTTWVRDNQGSWQTVHEPIPPWRNLSPTSGVSLDSGGQVLRIGRQVWLRGFITSLDGNINTGVDLAYVPADCAPVGTGDRLIAGTCSLEGDSIIGVVRLGITTSGAIRADHQFTNQPQWVCLDSITYWIS